MSTIQQQTMAYTSTKTKATTKTTTDEKTKAFHSLGALFETSSDELPLVGKPDTQLLEALGLEAPAGKEWKIFVKAKLSKAGKPYLSAYLGLSDIRR
jgi:hypothetical protein